MYKTNKLYKINVLPCVCTAVTAMPGVLKTLDRLSGYAVAFEKLK